MCFRFYPRPFLPLNLPSCPPHHRLARQSLPFPTRPDAKRRRGGGGKRRGPRAETVVLNAPLRGTGTWLSLSRGRDWANPTRFFIYPRTGTGSARHSLIRHLANIFSTSRTSLSLSLSLFLFRFFANRHHHHHHHPLIEVVIN